MNCRIQISYIEGFLTVILKWQMKTMIKYLVPFASLLKLIFSLHMLSYIKLKLSTFIFPNIINY